MLMLTVDLWPFLKMVRYQIHLTAPQIHLLASNTLSLNA